MSWRRRASSWHINALPSRAFAVKEHYNKWDFVHLGPFTKQIWFIMQVKFIRGIYPDVSCFVKISEWDFFLPL